MDLRLILLCICIGVVLAWPNGPTPGGKRLAADVAEAIRRKLTRRRAAIIMGVSREQLDAQLNGTAHLSLRGVADLPASVYNELIHIRAQEKG